MGSRNTTGYIKDRKKKTENSCIYIFYPRKQLPALKTPIMAQFLGFPRPLKKILKGFKEKQITKKGSDLSGLNHCIPRKNKHKFGLAAVLLLTHSLFPSFPTFPRVT